MTLKVAVIGVGSMGRNHVRVCWEMPEVKLVGVADVNQTLASAIAHRYNTTAYTDFKRLLDEQRPDAVIISVPTMYHLEVALVLLC
jgi:UDP-N-acetylglucosamine 3-dehydrogenase